MIKKILSNGLTLILEKRNSNSVAIEITMRVGSENENDKILGISHFIEHLMFSGTKSRSSREIVEKIESLGGEFNAFTWNERTSYYIKIAGKHLDQALDVLSDCIKNSVFNEKEIEKERNVILSEIDIYTDTPTAYQWVLFQGKLFKRINLKNPIIGTKKTVRSITRNDILDYYKKHYNAANTIVTITGKFNDSIIKKVDEKFRHFGNKKIEINKPIKEPEQNKIEEYTEKRNIDHSYLIIGYKAPGRNDKDSYILDVIRVILGMGSSSRLFYEIRLKRGLGYSVGCHYEGNKENGYFVAYVTTDSNNIKKCKSIIIEEFQKIRTITEKELVNAKNFLEGQYLLENEDNFKRADILSNWEVIKDAKLALNYLNEMKKVTKEDVKRVASKYFHKNYCSVTITK